MSIAKSGDYSLVGGADGWEVIVQKNCEANEVHEYLMYLNAMRSLALLSNDYVTIKAHITKLSIVAGDKDSLDYLSSKGYKIDTSSNEKYVESLNAALSKRNNLMTRINMKRKEIERITLASGKENGKDKGLEQVLANLSYQLGIVINDDVTLARFNEYARIVRMNIEESKKQHGRNK